MTPVAVLDKSETLVKQDDLILRRSACKARNAGPDWRDVVLEARLQESYISEPRVVVYWLGLKPTDEVDISSRKIPRGSG